MVYTVDLKSIVERHAGSSPASGIISIVMAQYRLVAQRLEQRPYKPPVNGSIPF